jgi:hypothetical protein
MLEPVCFNVSTLNQPFISRDSTLIASPGETVGAKSVSIFHPAFLLGFCVFSFVLRSFFGLSLSSNEDDLMIRAGEPIILDLV